MHDCARTGEEWNITATRKKGPVVLSTSHERLHELCAPHAEDIMNGYQLTDNHSEVDEIHWVRFIFVNMIIGGLLGFGLGVGMIRLVEKLFGPDSTLARAGNKAIILYILAAWGAALFVGWGSRV